MESPEKKLQEQAALARAVRAEQKIVPQPAATDATVINFDADIGRDVIQLSDGSIRYATPLASGVRSAGDTVLVHQSGEVYSDALPHIKKRVSGRPRKVPQVSYPFKILFSVVEDGLQKFYIGGDRKKPTLVLNLASNQRLEKAVITNIGKNENDWIIGIQYIGSGIPETVNLYGKDLNDSENNWSIFKSPYQPVQFGFWVYKEQLIDARNTNNINIQTNTSVTRRDVQDGGDIPTGTVFRSPALNSNFPLTAESPPNALANLVISPPINLGVMSKNGLGRFVGIDIWSGLQFISTISSYRNSNRVYSILPEFNNNYANGSSNSEEFFATWGVTSRIDTSCDSVDAATGVRIATDDGSDTYQASYDTVTASFKNAYRYKDITGENTGSASHYTRSGSSNVSWYQQCPQLRRYTEAQSIIYSFTNSQSFGYVLPSVTVENRSYSLTKVVNYAINRYLNQTIVESSSTQNLDTGDYSNITVPILVTEGFTNSLAYQEHTETRTRDFSRQPREQTTINEKKYSIYSQSGESLDVDTSLLAEQFSPNASFDSFIKSENGFKIIRVNKEEVLKLQNRNNKIQSIVIDLRQTGNQFVAQKLEKPLEVSLLSLKAEGKNITIHSISYCKAE